MTIARWTASSMPPEAEPPSLIRPPSSVASSRSRTRSIQGAYPKLNEEADLIYVSSVSRSLSNSSSITTRDTLTYSASVESNGNGSSHKGQRTSSPHRSFRQSQPIPQSQNVSYASEGFSKSRTGMPPPPPPPPAPTLRPPTTAAIKPPRHSTSYRSTRPNASGYAPTTTSASPPPNLMNVSPTPMVVSPDSFTDLAEQSSPFSNHSPFNANNNSQISTTMTEDAYEGKVTVSPQAILPQSFVDKSPQAIILPQSFVDTPTSFSTSEISANLQDLNEVSTNLNNNNSEIRIHGKEDNNWRQHGRAFRAALVKHDEETGHHAFEMSNDCSIRRYHLVAEKVLDQFLATRDEPNVNLRDTYLVGTRLSKFLSKILPTHKDFNLPDPELSDLRRQSHDRWLKLSHYLEELALIIDEEEHNQFVLRDLNTIDRLEEEEEEAPTEDISRSFAAASPTVVEDAPPCMVTTTPKKNRSRNNRSFSSRSSPKPNGNNEANQSNMVEADPIVDSSAILRSGGSDTPTDDEINLKAPSPPCMVITTPKKNKSRANNRSFPKTNNTNNEVNQSNMVEADPMIDSSTIHRSSGSNIPSYESSALIASSTIHRSSGSNIPSYESSALRAPSGEQGEEDESMMTGDAGTIASYGTNWFSLAAFSDPFPPEENGAVPQQEPKETEQPSGGVQVLEEHEEIIQITGTRRAPSRQDHPSIEFTNVTFEEEEGHVVDLATLKLAMRNSKVGVLHSAAEASNEKNEATRPSTPAEEDDSKACWRIAPFPSTKTPRRESSPLAIDALMEKYSKPFPDEREGQPQQSASKPTSEKHVSWMESPRKEEDSRSPSVTNTTEDTSSLWGRPQEETPEESESDSMKVQYKPNPRNSGKSARYVALDEHDEAHQKQSTSKRKQVAPANIKKTTPRGRLPTRQESRGRQPTRQEMQPIRREDNDDDSLERISAILEGNKGRARDKDIKEYRHRGIHHLKECVRCLLD